MNVLVSVLNESYGDARANAEYCAEELEMALLIEQSLTNIFHEESNWTEFKLFCMRQNSPMCLSEACRAFLFELRKYHLVYRGTSA